MMTADPPLDPRLSPTLRTAQLLNGSGPHRYVTRVLLAFLAIFLVVMFLPWQQNVQGMGAVTALRPEDRPQVVPSLIAGRIERWHVQEGARVRKGDVLVELSEIRESYLDPRTVARTGEQVTGKRDAVRAKSEKVAALERQIEALERARDLALDKARAMVARAEAAVVAAETDSAIAAARWQRNQQLFDEGLKSRTEFEAFQLQRQATIAVLVRTRQDLQAAQIEIGSLQAEYAEKIAKASSDRSATLAEIGDGRAEVAKLEMQYSALQIRSGMVRITAPQDGYVVRAVRTGIGEAIKEGDPVVTVMPGNPERAVELFVKAVDVPLLSAGRKVRLQFDGWPALQFSGWPSVSVGTFGGVIAVVDFVNAVDGSYRILVAPDPADEPWPRELRVGSGVLGWAMLDEVPVWFEIWRRFNGFPPTVGAPRGAPGGKA